MSALDSRRIPIQTAQSFVSGGHLWGWGGRYLWGGGFQLGGGGSYGEGGIPSHLQLVQCVDLNALVFLKEFLIKRSRFKRLNPAGRSHFSQFVVWPPGN